MGLQNCTCQAARAWRAEQAALIEDAKDLFDSADYQDAKRKADRSWLDPDVRVWTATADARVYHPENGVEYISQAHMKGFVEDAANLSWEGWNGDTLNALLDEAEEDTGWACSMTFSWGRWKDSELASWVPAFSCIA